MCRTSPSRIRPRFLGTSEYGCAVEFTMKDITTVRNQPDCLRESAEIAIRMVEADPTH
jgi:hypothetical protein